MTSLIRYLWPANKPYIANNKSGATQSKSVVTSTAQAKRPNTTDITIAVAESVTAGALANTLCSEPGASAFFKGGVVAYSINSKKEILGVNIEYAERNNFANPVTTSEMARSVVKMFKARFGMATTGYSLPITRPENKETGECALDIKKPYAYICLYDSALDIEYITREEFEYNINENPTIQKASVQARVALKAKQMYENYKINNTATNASIGITSIDITHTDYVTV